MVKYARAPPSVKTAKASGKDMRVHFKNTYEVAGAIRGMRLEKAQKYLQDVIEHKRCIPYRVFSATAGRTAQAHQFNVTQGRSPLDRPRTVAQEVLRARPGALGEREGKRRHQGTGP